jgi:hypothetical protein
MITQHGKALCSTRGSLAQENCNHYKITWNFEDTGQPDFFDAKEGKIDNLAASNPSSEHQVDYWKKQDNKCLQMLTTSEVVYYKVQVLY